MEDHNDVYVGRCRLTRYLNKRHIIIFICCCFTLNANIVRELMTITLPAWANITDVERLETAHVCNLSQPFPDLAVPMPDQKLFSFKKHTVEQMKNSYYIGAAVTKLPGGILADKFGGRRILLIYGIITSLLVLMCPTLIQYSDGKHWVILGWNVVLGVAAGPLFPTVNSVTAQWTPKFRRTTMICFVNVTFSLGVSVGRTLLRYIISRTNYWPSVYYIWCCLVIFTSVMWYFFGFSSIQTHPFITSRERRFLLNELGKSLIPIKNKSIPFTKIFTSIPFWASFFNHMGRGWAFFNLYLYVPMYLATVLEIDLSHNFVMGQIVPYILLGMSDLCSGILCDYLVNKDIMDVTTTRKIFSNFGAVGVGVYTVTTSLTGCNQKLTYALFLISLCYMGAYNTGVSANDIDLSVNYAGTLKGITDSFEHWLTLAMPLMMDKWTRDHSVQGWRCIFFILLVVVMVSNCCFTIAGRAREQSWNIPRELRK